MSLLVTGALVALFITCVFVLYSFLQVDDLEGFLKGESEDYTVNKDAAEVYITKNEGLIIITDRTVAQYQSGETVISNPVLNTETFDKYLSEKCVKLGAL